MTSPDLYLGIDTGGTFTDGVLLEPLTRRVVKKAKVLTTHYDLRVCIGDIIDALVGLPVPPSGWYPAPAGVPGCDSAIRLVSLSTTLATNSIAEGKSRPVALFLLGYDPDLVYKFEFDRQFGGSPLFFIEGRHDLNGKEKEPLNLGQLEAALRGLDGQVEALAISSFAGTRNPDHEEQAGRLAAQYTRYPVVQGHHLSDTLDSIRRATTARLNAALLSTAYEFLRTVQARLEEKGLHSPLYVVKGDGSLASAGYAAQRPVEMIHSGPATSAIGGSYLAGAEAALVIDIGGTTTDLALTRGGSALQGSGEASVGDYRTGLQTIQAHSFGLGGDSLIRFDPHQRLTLGPERAIPLSFLAHQYPEVRQDLLKWLDSAPPVWYSDRLEYWLPRRPPHQPLTNARALRALELLRQGPARVRWLVKQVGAVSPVQLSGDQLIRQDIVAVAGLTPTDLLHVTGEFAPWDREIACRVVEAAAKQWGISPTAWIERVRGAITRRITAEILQFLSGARLVEKDSGFKRKDLAHFLFDENLSGADPFLGVNFQLKLPIVGIGAPAAAFLPPVAAALHAEMIFPEHYEVANAVGTVVGNILVSHTAEVVPWVDGNLQKGYHSRAAGTQRSFESRSEALEAARRAVIAHVTEEARASGAASPSVDLEETELAGDMVRLVARAAGKPV